MHSGPVGLTGPCKAPARSQLEEISFALRSLNVGRSPKPGKRLVKLPEDSTKNFLCFSSQADLLCSPNGLVFTAKSPPDSRAGVKPG